MVQLTQKNCGVYWTAFLTGKTAGGRPLSQQELGELGQAFIKYAKEMPTKAKAATKMHKIQERLNDLGLSDLLEQQQAVCSELDEQSGLLAEIEKVQQDAVRKLQVLKAKQAATNKRAHDTATATSSHVQQQQAMSQACTDADAEADAATEAKQDAMQEILTAERAKNHKIYKGCETLAVELEKNLKRQHAEEVSALKEQMETEQKRCKRAQGLKRKADAQGIKVIQRQSAALQELTTEKAQLETEKEKLATELEGLKDYLEDTLQPDLEPNAEPNVEPKSLEASLEAILDSDSESDSADEDELRAALQREVVNRFEDMSPAQREEWFRTRMQDPVFVAGLEQRQRDMEELDEESLDKEFLDSAEEDA